jgi:biotin-(acetyl-CoA carboxylase) ligase
MTKQDIEDLIAKYTNTLKKYYEQRNQKNQIKMIIESMQQYTEGAEQNVSDSPQELLKDILMHLI